MKHLLRKIKAINSVANREIARQKSMDVRKYMESEIFNLIREFPSSRYHVWNVPCDRLRDIEELGIDFVKESNVFPLNVETWMREELGVKRVINMMGHYILLRY